MSKNLTRLEAIKGKLKDFSSAQDDIDGVIRYLTWKQDTYGSMVDAERAKLFWEMTLKNEKRIAKAQDPQCQFVILVPVYGEKTDRILRQINSLKEQINLKREEFEIIYIINNGPRKNNLNAECYLNDLLIEALQEISDLNIHVIDKSTAGNEIVDCNVGKARNRGTAEASLRFHENLKNGYLIHTDADTYFHDALYFEKLKTIIAGEQTAIGFSGGKSFEFNPDNIPQSDVAVFQRKVGWLTLFKKWNALQEFKLGNKHYVNGAYQTFFTGVHMISKSFESASIGGLMGESALEDVVFGFELQDYAERTGQKVIGVKDSLLLTSAIRESTRTKVSFGKEFDEINLQKQYLVQNPFASESPAHFEERISKIFENANFDISDLKKIFSDENGNLTVEEGDFKELSATAKYYASQRVDAVQMKMMVGILYNTRYPKIPLTEENYRRLEQLIIKQPGGKELVLFMDRMTKTVS